MHTISGRSIAAALKQAALLAAEACSFDDLSETVPLLKRGLRADRLVVIDHVAGEHPHGVFGDLEECAPDHYFREFFACDPVVRQHHQWTAKIVFPTRDVERRAWQRSVAYQNYYRHRDLGHIMGARLNSTPFFANGTISLVAFRSFTEPMFNRSDSRMLNPWIGAFESAFRRASRMDNLVRMQVIFEELLQRSSSRPILVFDLSARLVFASKRAIDLLGPSVGRKKLDPHLLAAVHRLAAFAERGTAPRPNDWSLAIATAHGEPVRAELSLERTTTNECFVLIELVTDLPDVREELPRALRRYRLTSTEERVLSEIASGCSNADIARRFHVSVGTVKTHVHRILGKLGVNTRLQAALLYERRTPSSGPSSGE